MADYRDISQQYAQGGIKAAIILNGGAAIAVLSQTSQFLSQGMATSLRQSMLSWSLGLFVAGITWGVGFASTRYYDRYEREHAPDLLKKSNFFMTAGFCCVVASMVCFLLGCVFIVAGFGASSD